MRQKDYDAQAATLYTELIFADPIELPGLVAAVGALREAPLKLNPDLDTLAFDDLLVAADRGELGLGAAPTFRLPIRARVRGWIHRHIVAPDPAPAPSRLDRLDSGC